MKKPPEYKTLKVRAETYALLHELVVAISNTGWTALGIEREGPPNLSMVADEAVQAFMRFVKGKSR